MIGKSTHSVFRDAKKDLVELVSYTDRSEVKNDAISHWCIGEQIDHTLRANEQMLIFASKELGEEEEAKATKMLAHVIMLTGYIPRGRGKAPKFSIPDEYHSERFASRAEAIKDGLTALENDPKKLNDSTPSGNHPLFGGFTRKQWLRFLEVHQRHHLKIIRDIEKGA